MSPHPVLHALQCVCVCVLCVCVLCVCVCVVCVCVWSGITVHGASKGVGVIVQGVLKALEGVLLVQHSVIHVPVQEEEE